MSRITAKLVIVAAGLGGQQLGDSASTEQSPDSLVGVGAILATTDSTADRGVIGMACSRDGYVGTTVVELGRRAIAAALSPAALKQSSIAAVCCDVLTAAGASVPDGLEVADWKGTLTLTRHRPSPVAERMLYVGDAAGYVEPFTGEGIAWALRSGRIGGSFAARLDGEWSSAAAADWSRLYHEGVRSSQRKCRWLTRGLRHPLLVRGALAILRRCPWLVRPLVRKFTGGTAMSAVLEGLGTALPVHQMSQEDALAMTIDIVCGDRRQDRLASMLFKRSGVANRHTCVPHPIAYEWVGEELRRGKSRGPSTGERMRMYADRAPELAAESCRRALAAAGRSARDISHLVTVSCTGFDAPGVDISLFETLDLRPTVQRINVGYMGCHGAMNGLRAARGLLAAEPNAVVLLNATEMCSLHYRFTWDDEGVIGNALFADGSASLVLSNSPVERGLGYRIAATGSCLLPDSKQAMSWTIGDHGFEMTLTSLVPERIEEHLRPWLSEWLGDAGLALDDVAHWIVHPGGPRILEAVESSLSLDRVQTQPSWDVLSECGNMSSPTVLFILECVLRGTIKGPAVLLGFGPGLMAEACLLRP
ncbi:MAG: 3-oxoacyl-[acyl-carrier-protein] synthase III C-terminal domain-containing protein [Planctomycetaceae bacterium]